MQGHLLLECIKEVSALQLIFSVPLRELEASSAIDECIFKNITPGILQAATSSHSTSSRDQEACLVVGGQHRLHWARGAVC